VPTCARDGCPEQVERGYCPEHTTGPSRRPRSPSSRVTGTHRWRVLKARILRGGPDCHYCGDPATTVDHVIPVSKGGAPYDEANLVPSCKPCNDRKGGRLA
jgi:5-methylcytosine-specific restriction endonuclease McrA